MEKTIDKSAAAASKALGQADSLVLAFKDGSCAAVIKGSADSIAHAFFCCMHGEDDEAAAALYRILKLNLLNILKNPSPLAADLARTVAGSIPPEHEG